MNQFDHSPVKRLLSGVVAVFLTALLITLGQVSVRPDWHANIHAALSIEKTDGLCDSGTDDFPDADPEAGCAIDLYGNGSIHLLEAAAPIEAGSAFVTYWLPTTTSQIPCAAPRGTPPGRAPPSMVLS